MKLSWLSKKLLVFKNVHVTFQQPAGLVARCGYSNIYRIHSVLARLPSEHFPRAGRRRPSLFYRYFIAYELVGRFVSSEALGKDRLRQRCALSRPSLARESLQQRKCNCTWGKAATSSMGAGCCWVVRATSNPVSHQWRRRSLSRKARLDRNAREGAD